MTYDKAFNFLNNSKLDEEGSSQMEFNSNETPAEIIKEGAFGGTYFRDIYWLLMKNVQKLMERNQRTKK